MVLSSSLVVALPLSLPPSRPLSLTDLAGNRTQKWWCGPENIATPTTRCTPARTQSASGPPIVTYLRAARPNPSPHRIRVGVRRGREDRLAAPRILRAVDTQILRAIGQILQAMLAYRV